MKGKLLICVVLSGILFSACGPSQSRISAEETQMANIKAEETQLAEILQATLTANAPTATLVPTDTPMPTETPDPYGKFIVPFEMLETFFPDSEGWEWKESAGRRGEKKFPENNHKCTIKYSTQLPLIYLNCGIKMKEWINDDFTYSVFEDILSKVVDANAQLKMMEFIQSVEDIDEKFKSEIDRFDVSIEIKEGFLGLRQIDVFIWGKFY